MVMEVTTERGAASERESQGEVVAGDERQKLGSPGPNSPSMQRRGEMSGETQLAVELIEAVTARSSTVRCVLSERCRTIGLATASPSTTETSGEADVPLGPLRLFLGVDKFGETLVCMPS